MDENDKTPVVEDIPVSPYSDKELDEATDCLPSPPPAPAPAPARSPPQVSVPSLRARSEISSNMTVSSTPLGQLNAARRGGAPAPRAAASVGGQPGGLNQDILAKMKAFSLSRQGAPPGLAHTVSTGGIPTSTHGTASIISDGAGNPLPKGPPSIPSGAIAGGLPGRLPPPGRPPVPNWSSAPSMPGSGATVSPKPGGLAAKRLKPGLKLSDVTSPPENGRGPSPAGQSADGPTDSVFSRYADIIDTKAGTLTFKNKALLHGGGIEFSSGQSFNISLDEVDRLEELGKGNYGTVYKVRHSRPHMRKPGLGLSGIVSRAPGSEGLNAGASQKPQDNLSGVVMAMKEIRLELDEKKFAQIIMELDILHRCVSPFIIDFYGAFFQEGAVYICVEYMDGGSVERLYEGGIPEHILRKITLSTVMGLKTLKDDHEIIHRDVKPTNILINTRGQVKICDFGVSGNLVASIAKTNIGCQSYMAPERIAGGGMQQSGANSDGTYGVQSDIWSLGLTIIECAMGRYPYAPETFNNIFSQLQVS
jgi:mitogen-activated protein kinase kinase